MGFLGDVNVELFEVLFVCKGVFDGFCWVFGINCINIKISDQVDGQIIDINLLGIDVMFVEFDVLCD